MTSDTILAVGASLVVSAAAALYSFGVFRGKIETLIDAKFQDLRGQMNGIGAKVGAQAILLTETDKALRKNIRNHGTALQLITPEEKARDVASLLKE